MSTFKTKEAMAGMKYWRYSVAHRYPRRRFSSSKSVSRTLLDKYFAYQATEAAYCK